MLSSFTVTSQHSKQFKTIISASVALFAVLFGLSLAGYYIWQFFKDTGWHVFETIKLNRPKCMIFRKQLFGKHRRFYSCILKIYITDINNIFFFLLHIPYYGNMNYLYSATYYLSLFFILNMFTSVSLYKIRMGYKNRKLFSGGILHAANCNCLPAEQL